ncbi:MAG: hypothetical protein LUG51_01285 [Tannerellaceae bacterium]|nr:hypothetical protein [Tannerellaceae bacterium]
MKIKINLGHETLKEKDILSLITGELRDQYIKYTNSWKNFDAIKGSHLAADLLISGFLFYIFLVVIHTTMTIENQYVEHINKVLLKLRGDDGFNNIGGVPVFDILVFILLLVVSDGLRSKIGKYIHKHLDIPLSPTYIIQERLEELNERIESSISMGQSTLPSPNKFFQINIGSKKNKTYATASAREIEQELIRILDMIRSNRLYPLQIVIILDELDKTDPVTLSSQTKQPASDLLPEYEKSTTITTGGGRLLRPRKRMCFH